MNFSEGRQGGCGRTPRTPLNPPLADFCVSAASTDGRRQSRSAVSADLLVPWTRTSTGQRSFETTWNRLPTALRSPELTPSSFKRQLKTHSSVPALDSARCSCGCRVPSSGAVVTVQRLRRRLQMSRLDSTQLRLISFMERWECPNIFYRAMLCMRGTSHGPVSVCLCLSQVGVLLKRLNIGSQKQHTIAQRL